jgi:chaperonin GroES
MNIKPLFDNVIVEPKKEEEKSKTGIVLSTTNEEQTLTGKVLAVGKDVENDIKVGDFVVYAPFSGKEIGGKLIIGSHDLMGIIEEKKEEGNCVCTAACGAGLGHNKKTGICEKHGKVMLHDGKCSECRESENKTIRQELCDKNVRELDQRAKEIDKQLLGENEK